MSSKKESWNLDNNGKGTKTTTKTDDNGNQTTIVQKADTNFFGVKEAWGIISTETKTKSK